MDICHFLEVSEWQYQSKVWNLPNGCRRTIEIHATRVYFGLGSGLNDFMSLWWMRVSILHSEYDSKQWLFIRWNREKYELINEESLKWKSWHWRIIQYSSIFVQSYQYYRLIILSKDIKGLNFVETYGNNVIRHLRSEIWLHNVSIPIERRKLNLKPFFQYEVYCV